ncbi:MAG TPA: ribosome maturation factor RimP [Terriglobales bacterium]|jgi:ribosome maturation factor RimP|nr:ribosome maturation factor RimP [Terriglobales bacterium]
MPFDEARVRAIAERIGASSGLEVVDLEFHGGGKGRLLRLFIEKNAEGRRALEQQFAAAAEAGEKVPSPVNWDRLAGITHEDCANYSRELSTVLDVEDAVPGGEYLLEVSSPGLDRKLVKPADFQRFSGSKVKIMTREPVAGNRHFEGRLRTLDDSRIALDLESSKKKGKHKKKSAVEGDTTERAIELEMSNIERARLVPEI